MSITEIKKHKGEAYLLGTYCTSTFKYHFHQKHQPIRHRNDALCRAQKKIKKSRVAYIYKKSQQGPLQRMEGKAADVMSENRMRQEQRALPQTLPQLLSWLLRCKLLRNDKVRIHQMGSLSHHGVAISSSTTQPRKCKYDPQRGISSRNWQGFSCTTRPRWGCQL